MNEEVMKLGEIILGLKKRIVLILSITIGCALISGIISFKVIKPRYEANTKLYIGKDEVGTEEYNYSEVQMYQKLMKTYVEIIKTKDLVSRAIDEANLDIGTNDALSSIGVTPRTDTQILEIRVRHEDPELAMKLTEVITSEFIKISKDLITNSNVRIIQQVELPKYPISPNKKMNVGIAFLLGMMLAIGVALILEFLDNTYKTKDQLEKELELPVLGVIPMSEE